MPHHHRPHLPLPTSLRAISISISISTLFFVLSSLPTLPATQTPVEQKQPFLPNPTTTSLSSSPPATIPSFPEQSAFATCPISLPDELFPAVRSWCVGGGEIEYGQLHRSRCCPVLAAWLYSAYSATALGTSGTSGGNGVKGNGNKTAVSSTYEMPMLPDDSETCVDGLESAMRERGVELGRPNASCDVVYCYCGIRLHQMSCPASFHLTQKGGLSGDENVDRLERDCLPVNGGGDANNGGIVGCSKCLNSLYKLNKGNQGGNNYSTKSVEEPRTTMMRSRDCELTGLTWLLNKNRTTYLHTVTLVLRALMVSGKDGSEHGSGPVSCCLDRDGMPLAVDSSEISGTSIASKDLFLLLSICLMMHTSFSVLLLGFS